MSLVVSVHKTEEIDFGLLGIDFTLSHQDKMESLHNLLTEEMSLVGGKGGVEICELGIGVAWDSEVGGTIRDKARNLYFAHLIQVGMLKDPILQISNTAYNGGAMDLAQSLLIIHSYGFHPKMVARDIEMLAVSVPFHTGAGIACGIVKLDQGYRADALDTFKFVFEQVSPTSYMAMKYIALCILGDSPHRAVKMMEDCLATSAKQGMLPGESERVTYGMALWAAGAIKEAAVQFKLAGFAMPKMTPDQWGDWGYRVDPTVLGEALADPKKGLWYTKWAERGEDAPYRKPV